jgi:hypothetical protein
MCETRICRQQIIVAIITGGRWIVIAALILCCTSTSFAQATVWEKLGPFKETPSGVQPVVVYDMVINDNGPVVVAGEDVVYRWDEEGAIWTATEVSTANSGVVISTHENEIITGLLRKSTDGGISWQPVYAVGITGRILSMTSVPATGDLFAGVTTYGVFRSIDRGHSWKSLGLERARTEVVIAAPDGSIYAGGGFSGGVFRSENRGNEWYYIGLAAHDVLSLATAPGGSIYAGTKNEGVFGLSEETGQWRDLGLAGLDINDILPDGTERLYAATSQGVYVSIDEGSTWHHLVDEVFGATPTYKLAFGGNEQLYAATARGLLRGTIPVNVSNEREVAPMAVSLAPNYPNPFNPTTTISFELSAPTVIRLAIFDLLGREVHVIAEGLHPAGSYSRRWDATGFPSGAYLYTLEGKSFSHTRKLILMR